MNIGRACRAMVRAWVLGWWFWGRWLGGEAVGCGSEKQISPLRCAPVEMTVFDCWAAVEMTMFDSHEDTWDIGQRLPGRGSVWQRHRSGFQPSEIGGFQTQGVALGWYGTRLWRCEDKSCFEGTIGEPDSLPASVRDCDGL
jgi:hypothetical protein